MSQQKLKMIYLNLLFPDVVSFKCDQFAVEEKILPLSFPNFGILKKSGEQMFWQIN